MAIVTCEEHGTDITDGICEPCHRDGHHDSQCLYKGAGLWNCGVVDGEISCEMAAEEV